MSAAKRSIRPLLESSEISVVPGAGTALEARVIEECGFPAIYVSGYATAAAVHGLPDIGLIGSAEVVANVEAIRHVTTAPLIVDADTGYGDAVNVRDTVRRLERAGASAIQLEDQVWPKRCGHMADKEVVDANTMARKVRAAVAARRDENTVIIARTDARAPLGLDEAIRRARLYRAAGADATFVDAPQSVDELRRIAAEVEGPSVVNMSETGLTPLLSARDLGELGFSLVIFPSSAVRVTAHALRAFLEELRRTGDSRSWVGSMASLGALNGLVGLDDAEAFDASIADEAVQA
ncbi:MAG: isocitrate lyase/phosphoenolpyruvate mutase family protein [Solirubrobacteraceae bacterium]|nr:isocitrate lyase/phosphoenolpyruvate mutase family protein [Solirubrobacteraceae bacterium]